MGVTGVKTLMIAGGGTGGHIYPAIAIAREYIARDKSRRVVFVGTERGLEKTIVPKAGFPLEFISVGGLKGKGLGETLKNLFRLPRGFFQARLRGVPTAIHEQNAFPGVTNRLAARFVNAVAVAFADAGPRLNRSDAVVT